MKIAETAVIEKKSSQHVLKKAFGATFLFFFAKGMIWVLVFSGLLKGIW